MCSMFSVCSKRFFCHHDVHDVLELYVGVVWCFNFDVPSVGRAFKWYHSASVCCVCERTIRPETDPLSLLCHGFDGHQRSSYICLSKINGHWFAFCILDTSKRRSSSHKTDLPAVEYRTAASASRWHLYPRAAGCPAGTTVLHAAVSTPNVICLHLLSDPTPTVWPTDSMP